MSFLKEAFKDVLQEMLEAEMDLTLGYSREDSNNKATDNSRNGYSTKKLKSEFGPVQIDIPRDRKGEFEPKIIQKYKRDVSGIENKVISLYARGMSTRDIDDLVKDLYGIDVSAEMVSKITEKIVPEIRKWQGRPLEPIYPFVFMDAILSKAFHKIAYGNNDFIESKQQQLSRWGISYILDKYVEMARSNPEFLVSFPVTPHVLRHSKSMHMLQSGVNLIYMRDFLGHVDCSTTEVYARADSEMKRKAIENAYVDLVPDEIPRWEEDGELM